MSKISTTIAAIIVLVGVGYFVLDRGSSPTVTQETIVGSWRSVITNPKYKNSVARRYMKHTFLADGKLTVQDKENSTESAQWVFKDGIFVATGTHDKSVFTTTYEIIDENELKVTRFQSVVDGEPVADYVPKDRFIREGSRKEKQMKIVDIF